MQRADVLLRPNAAAQPTPQSVGCSGLLGVNSFSTMCSIPSFPQSEQYTPYVTSPHELLAAERLCARSTQTNPPTTTNNPSKNLLPESNGSSLMTGTRTRNAKMYKIDLRTSARIDLLRLAGRFNKEARCPSAPFPHSWQNPPLTASLTPQLAHLPGWPINHATITTPAITICSRYSPVKFTANE